MKEIREIKMVEQVKVQFVADDGKVFEGENAEKLCIEHERRNNYEKVKKEFNKLDIREIDFPFSDTISDCVLYLVRLNNIDDFNRLNDKMEHDYSSNYEQNACNTRLKDMQFPCSKILFQAESWCDLFDADEKLIEKLEKAIEILKGKN